MDFGHYYCFALNQEKQWIKFDDSRCSEQSSLKLDQDETPYMIFYRRSDAIAEEEQEIHKYPGTRGHSLAVVC